ncbi:FAD-dependent oxidoreductase [Nonomuraea fuscirosea]|uniref:FAD-dependent oxidoreductase n=1 Tax=Nonomuraea fuscirosea TaxID=1291556 RepID=UPI003426CA89
MAHHRSRPVIAVIGAGLMGAATAWQLARRGAQVTLIEAYEIGHRHGSSHGTSRIFRRVYDDPFYVDLTGRAAECWRDLESDSGTALLRTTGGLDFGAGRDLEGLAALVSAAGVACELLPERAARERWPFARFDGPVLFHPQAGVVDADATVAACVRRAAELGADVRTGTRVREVRTGGNSALVRMDDGSELAADTVVVAAGAWLPELADAIGTPLRLPPLRVTQQQVFHFRQRDPAQAWPTLVATDELLLYGLPSGADGGAAPAVKIAEHDRGTPTTASTRDGIVNPASRDAVSGWVARRLPGLDPEPVAEAVCLYTTTPDEDFVLDRVGPVVVVSPCSGHGAKFTPLIGHLAADLALGAAGPLPRFALR